MAWAAALGTAVAGAGATAGAATASALGGGAMATLAGGVVKGGINAAIGKTVLGKFGKAMADGKGTTAEKIGTFIGSGGEAPQAQAKPTPALSLPPETPQTPPPVPQNQAPTMPGRTLPTQKPKIEFRPFGEHLQEQFNV